MKQESNLASYISIKLNYAVPRQIGSTTSPKTTTNSDHENTYVKNSELNSKSTKFFIILKWNIKKVINFKLLTIIIIYSTIIKVKQLYKVETK